MANAQSGRSSAVGFAMETAFRNVPLTNIGGVNYRVGIATTNPNRFMIVEPGGGYSVKPTKDVGESEIDGDFSIHRVTMTGKTYDGKDSFKFDPENAYYPLLGIFGRDVETTLAAGAYKHVFTLNKYAPSFTQEEQFGDGTSGRLTSGVCFAGLSLTHSAILMGELSYYGHRQIPNRYTYNGTDVDYDFQQSPGLLPSQMGGDGTKKTLLTLTPGYVDVAEGNCGNGPLVFAQMQPGSEAGFGTEFVKINDAVTPTKFLPGFNVDFTRDIERFMVAGSEYDMGVPVASLFKAAGKMDILFQDNTVPLNTLANCKFSINMKFVGPQIGATGQYYTYELYLPRVKFLEANLTRPDKAIVTGGNFIAEKDASLGYEAKVTLINSFTNAALAGVVPQAGLGLGGWSPSA